MTEHQVSDHVAEKIREARKQRGWNTDDLAARCGLTGNIIENIESGRRDHDGHRRRDITVDELFAISEALNIGPLKLLPGSRARDDSSDQEAAIRAAREDLGRDRRRLDDLNDVLARIGEERTTLEDKIAKNEWLIEQLQDGR